MFPKKLLKEITTMMVRFWWNHNQNDKNNQWKSWTQMGELEKRGGLRFKDLESIYKAILTKKNMENANHQCQK